MTPLPTEPGKGISDMMGGELSELLTFEELARSDTQWPLTEQVVCRQRN